MRSDGTQQDDSDLHHDRYPRHLAGRPKTLRAKLKRELAHAITHRRRFGKHRRLREIIPLAP